LLTADLILPRTVTKMFMISSNFCACDIMQREYHPRQFLTWTIRESKECKFC